MNKKLMTGLTASALLFTILVAGATSVNATTTLDCTQDNQLQRTPMMFNRVDRTINADGLSSSWAIDTSSVNLEELNSMLTVLIEDEYKARAEYEAIIDTFGSQEPFTNLIQAETMHIRALSNLFTIYGLDIPEDNGATFAVVPETLQDAYQIGIQAENDNAALYEAYLTEDLPLNVERVMTNLMKASLDNHLVTFEAYANGTEIELHEARLNDRSPQKNMPFNRGNRR